MRRSRPRVNHALPARPSAARRRQNLKTAHAPRCGAGLKCYAWRLSETWPTSIISAAQNRAGPSIGKLEIRKNIPKRFHHRRFSRDARCQPITTATNPTGQLNLIETTFPMHRCDAANIWFDAQLLRAHDLRIALSLKTGVLLRVLPRGRKCIAPTVAMRSQGRRGSGIILHI
jgi:hypothetical protein